jgi:hypothetical protein
MREELLVSVQSFYGDIRVRLGLVTGLLLLLASALLAAFGKPTPAWASLLVGLVTLIVVSFWAYHQLRLRHEAGYIDPRLEKEEQQGTFSHGVGYRMFGRRGIFHRANEPLPPPPAPSRLFDADTVFFRPLLTLARGTVLRCSFDAPVYTALAGIRLPGQKRVTAIDTVSRDLKSIEVTIKDVEVPTDGQLRVKVSAPAPIRLLTAKLTMPPADPPSTTAAESPPPSSSG